MVFLTASTSKVKKAGKGIKLTDKAVFSGYGDSVGEVTVVNTTDKGLILDDFVKICIPTENVL